ncbi:MAG: glycosyl transferase family 2 [Mucilaginibacter sp.]|nr:glycosyl transferase family 2 [Mucilaginibacter sp.]
MEVKITVVIPTYRRPKLLTKCLAALNHQTFARNEYEVIVISDGPDEITAKAIGADPKYALVKFLSTAEKKGPAAARNMGWLQAKGKLIAFTDDDCLPDQAWLQTIWQNYKGEEEIAFTGKMIVPVSQPPTDYELNIANLETAEFVTANCVCTKNALVKTGGFDERFKMAWREDSDLHFKLLENNILIHTIPAVVVHPVRKAPWGISIKEQKKGVFNALLYKKHPQLYRQRIKSQPSWKYYLIVLLFTGIFLSLIAGSNPAAICCAAGWLILTLDFCRKRLAKTSRAPMHLLEMLITSMIIPFLSVYWQIYGAIKYRI